MAERREVRNQDKRWRVLLFPLLRTRVPLRSGKVQDLIFQVEQKSEVGMEMEGLLEVSHISGLRSKESMMLVGCLLRRRTSIHESIHEECYLSSCQTTKTPFCSSYLAWGQPIQRRIQYWSPTFYLSPFIRRLNFLQPVLEQEESDRSEVCNWIFSFSGTIS